VVAPISRRPVYYWTVVTSGDGLAVTLPVNLVSGNCVEEHVLSTGVISLTRTVTFSGLVEVAERYLEFWVPGRTETWKGTTSEIKCI
jgi:hypothetical protein